MTAATHSSVRSEPAAIDLAKTPLLACNPGQELVLQTPWGLGSEPMRMPVGLAVHGSSVFRVWSGCDSGEQPPAWAEPDFQLSLLDPNLPSGRRRVQQIAEAGRVCAARALAEHPRATAELTATACHDHRGVELRLDLANPQTFGGRNLPLSMVELVLGPFDLPDGAHYLSAHAYGGRTHGSGSLHTLDRRGLPFGHGVIGLAFPTIYIHVPGVEEAIEIEFLLDARPVLWLRRAADERRFELCLQWHLDRLLLPGERHSFGGALRIRHLPRHPIQAMRDYRDTAWDRFGLQPPHIPDWARKTSIIELWLQPGAYPDFTRHDDPNLLAMLKRWRQMGYDAIMAVSPNHTGKFFLSPYDYRPREECGGLDAEKTMLGWMHELGFRVFLWVTTVGLDKDSQPVREHREWWTHRSPSEYFYAWDSNAKTNYVGYAPDADPLSLGWRQFLEDQVRDVMHRGWDGIFIDGCIPRASNQARYRWPGEARNAVEEQTLALQRVVESFGPHTVTVAEDAGLGSHLTATINTGRYTPASPYLKKAYWDHGMGGGPELTGQAPPRVAPHQVREYLLVRYACMLPGTLSMDHAEGYNCEAMRPWTVQTMLAGPVCFKTHAEFVNDPLTYRRMHDAPAPEPIAKEPEHRRRGHDEFLKLLALRRDEPLVGMDTPLSLEAVRVQGSEAVIGMLRPTAERCLLIVLNFADAAARVSLTLGEPTDLPRVHVPIAGAPQRQRWAVRERLRSMVDTAALREQAIAPNQPLSLDLAPYGFRVLELHSPVASV